MDHVSHIIDLNIVRAYFARQPDVLVAYLFGSLARGQIHPGSDVDFAVLFDPSLEGEMLVERILDLMTDLSDFTSREVQVVALNLATPLLAFQATSEGILLYERSQSERIAFQTRAMKIYYDLKPRLDFFNQMMMDRIRETGIDRTTRNDSRTLEAAQRLSERLKKLQ